MKILGQLLLVGVVVFVLLQAVRPSIPAQAPTAELQAPPQVMQVLRKDCYSCHSNERRLSWFDEIVPGYWLVRHDILTAREHVNFSTIGAKPAAMQKATLFEAVNMIQLGAMPLPKFTALHPDAKVTPEELTILKTYLAPWSPVAPTAPKTDAAATAPAAALVSLPSVLPELDGFTFDGSFEGWKPLSTTDRGDNNTFRFILGNEIAVKAAQSGNISPWPDGAEFAKVTWQQAPGDDGLVHPGKFVQVELMRKDAQRYKNQEGWGWGRWRGMDLKPYGKDAKFVNECTSCHQPVKGDDYVYTMPMTPAKVAQVEVVNNHAAALPASLPYQPLGWNAITMYVDPKTHTMATLYGNDAAVKATAARGAVAAGPVSYPAGAVLALVTWVQRDDPHWFGARIPDSPQAVEFVEVGAPHAYRRYAGDGLGEDRGEAGLAMQRTAFVTGLVPARLP